MLHKTGQKRCSCLVHYFLFYVIAVTYFPFASCNGVRSELIPKRNALLGSLSKKSQEDYLRLMEMLDGDASARKKLEEKVNAIEKLNASADEKLDTLASFIKASLQTQQTYIDLLAILPNDQAIKFKNEIVECTNQDKVAQCIASWLPKSLLDGHVQERLSQLPYDKRRKILKAAMNQDDTEDGMDMHTGTVTGDNQAVAQPNSQNAAGTENKKPSQVEPNNQPTNPDTSNDGHSTISTSKTDINRLIEQELKAQEETKKVDGNIPQDGWGPKLPLEGAQREQFLALVIQFSKEDDRKELKELFDKTDPDSIKNFFSVFFTGFNMDERFNLLATMIYLYKCSPDLTLKLCNDPTSVGLWDKLRLYRKTNATQLELLTRLDNLLSQI